jgi:hypothetical protein
LQLAPEQPGGDFRETLFQALSERPAKIEEAGTDWMRFARYSAALWTTTLILDADPLRVAVTLPKEARDLQMVPKAGGIAVVFGMGNILEIWNEPLWNAHVMEVAGNVAAYIARAEDALMER